MSTHEARTGALSWDVSGSADAHGLLLIHSLGANKSMWDDQLAAFSKLRRVVTVDLPGHGESGAHAGEYSLEDLGLDVLDVAGAAGLDTFDVCGISLGGVIALWLAINRPEKVTHLIACNTAARIGTAEAWSERMEAVLNGGMASIRDGVVPRFITSDLGERRPEALSKVYEMFDSIDPLGYAGCCASLRHADLGDSLDQIGCPTLLIGGSEDVATPPEVTRELHGQIPASRIEVIDGAAHLSNIDQPEVFNRTVAGELAG